MLNVVLLGTGNLARHLFEAFSIAKGAKIIQVVGRNLNDLSWFSHHCAVSNDFTEIFTADVYLIAVKDDAIGEVSGFLAEKKGIVAHTSGAMELDVIKVAKKGVFYPLQTFSKGRTVHFKNIPICVEASDNKSLQVMTQLGRCVSENVQEIDSVQRKKLHLAAVFVNNFTNYLYSVGEALCLENDVSFDLLKPLILETAQKVQSMSPKKAQTGPARRNDRESMQMHLELLTDEHKKTLYTLLSTAIKETYEKEL